MSGKDGKTTFLLGAGKGLGLLLSSLLLKEGRSLIAMMAPGEESQYLKKNYPDSYHPIFSDSMDPKAIHEVIQEALSSCGPVDEVILMDGYRMYGALEELGELEINHSLQYNLIAPLYVLKAFLPQFRQQKHGRILALMSQDALLPSAGHGISNAARFALRGALESLKEEMEPFGVSLSIVALGELRVRPEPSDTRIAALTRTYDIGTAHDFLLQLKAQKRNGPVDPEKAAKRIRRV